jgi:hypothetical protein
MEDSKGEKEIHHHKQTMTEKLRKNPWMISTIVLGILILVFLVNDFGITGKSISEDKAGDIAINFLNSYVVSDNGVSLDSVAKQDGLYEVDISYKNNSVPVFLSLDGQYIDFGSGMVNINSFEELLSSQESNTQSGSEVIPKTDKPSVELFVMSFCPYGVRAEQNIIQVIDLLKDNINFKIRYIVNVNGDTITDVDSLHGIDEAKQDAIQLIINKYYPDKFLTYIENFDNNCYQYAQDSAQMDACWKSEASKLGMDTNKIETSAYSSEGIDLLKAEETEDAIYSVSGSPTLIINGVQSDAIYSGTSATQDAICSAFNTEPSGCSETLSDSTATATGSC